MKAVHYLMDGSIVFWRMWLVVLHFYYFNLKFEFCALIHSLWISSWSFDHLKFPDENALKRGHSTPKKNTLKMPTFEQASNTNSLIWPFEDVSICYQFLNILFAHYKHCGQFHQYVYNPNRQTDVRCSFRLTMQVT